MEECPEESFMAENKMIFKISGRKIFWQNKALDIHPGF